MEDVLIVTKVFFQEKNGDIQLFQQEQMSCLVSDTIMYITEDQNFIQRSHKLNNDLYCGKKELSLVGFLADHLDYLRRLVPFEIGKWHVNRLKNSARFSISVMIRPDSQVFKYSEHMRSQIEAH